MRVVYLFATISFFVTAEQNCDRYRNDVYALQAENLSLYRDYHVCDNLVNMTQSYNQELREKATKYETCCDSKTQSVEAYLKDTTKLIQDHHQEITKLRDHIKSIEAKLPTDLTANTAPIIYTRPFPIAQTSDVIFHKSDSRFTWEEANSYCQNHGLVMAIPKNSAEHELLRNYFIMTHMEHGCWTGINWNKPSVYQDSNYNQIDYTQIKSFFAPSQPDAIKSGSEKCIHYFWHVDSHSKLFSLNDWHCTNKLFALCEKRLN